MTLPVFAGVRVLGVDEHVWYHQDRRRRGPRELTGIVDHSRGGSSHGPLEWTWSRVGLAQCMRTGWPSAEKTFAPVFFAPVSRSRRWIPSRDRKNALDDQLQDATSVLDAFHIVKLAGDAPGEVCRPRPARHDWSPRTHRRPPLPRSAISCAPHTRRLTQRQQERLREAFTADEAHVSVDVAYLPSPGKCARSSTKPHPPKADAWPHTSSSAYQPVPSSKSLAWARPYASGRTHSTTTSTPTEQATAPRKPSTDIIELGRRIARGYRNPTSYQLRMLLIAGGLDASTHTQL